MYFSFQGLSIEMYFNQILVYQRFSTCGSWPLRGRL